MNGFLGPLTFAEIIEMFPPPPGFPDPEGALNAFDANDDDKLCAKGHPDGQNLIVVDNNAVGHASRAIASPADANVGPPDQGQATHPAHIQGRRDRVGSARFIIFLPSEEAP